MIQIIDPRMLIFISGKQYQVQKQLIISMFGISKDKCNLVSCGSVNSMIKKINKLEKFPKTIIAIIDKEVELKKLDGLRKRFRQIYFLAVLVSENLKTDSGLDTISLSFHGNNSYVRSQFLWTIKGEQNGLSYR